MIVKRIRFRHVYKTPSDLHAYYVEEHWWYLFGLIPVLVYDARIFR